MKMSTLIKISLSALAITVSMPMEAGAMQAARAWAAQQRLAAEQAAQQQAEAQPQREEEARQQALAQQQALARQQQEEQRRREEAERRQREEAAHQQALAQQQALARQQQEEQRRREEAEAQRQREEAARQQALTQQQALARQQQEEQRRREEAERRQREEAARQQALAQQQALAHQQQEEQRRREAQALAQRQAQLVNLDVHHNSIIFQEIEGQIQKNINLNPLIVDLDQITADNDDTFNRPVALILEAIKESGLYIEQKRQLLDKLGMQLNIVVPEFVVAELDGRPSGDVYWERMKSILSNIQEIAENLNHTNLVPINPIQELIEQIPLNPTFKSVREVMVQMRNNRDNINYKINFCISKIIELPLNQRSQWLDLLKEKIKKMQPTYDGGQKAMLPGQFNTAVLSMMANIESNNPMQANVKPKLDPQPAILPILALNTADNLNLAIDQLDRRVIDVLTDKNAPNRDKRLEEYVLSHWHKYYKTPAINANMIKRQLQNIFNTINLTGDSSVKKTAQKVVLIERILQDMMKITPHNGLTLGSIIQNITDSVHQNLVTAVTMPSIFTRMEKIKEFSSVNWDQVLCDNVYDLYANLKKGDQESQPAYWTRIGNYVIDIYNAKVKPYIYPDGLYQSLCNNNAVKLTPLNVIFSDYQTSTNAVTSNNCYIFDINTVNLSRESLPFKKELANSYEKIHDYFIKTLTQLFNTNHPIRQGLNWDWYHGLENDWNNPERLELCKRTLAIFAYFNRQGDHYNDDIVDTAALAGGFTHCKDGKKGAIGSVSSRILQALTGENEVLVAEDFDSVLKKRILPNFKIDTIDALANHDHGENVSIIGAIKQRHKDFWEFPCDIVANYGGNYRYCDYAYMDAGWNEAYNEDVSDKILQHFYQHIYVGSHELVNTIYAYLKTGNEEDSRKKCADFLGLAMTRLSKQRPFEELILNTFDFAPMFKARYCELRDPNKDNGDYMPTRKGLETILFYGDYLAWNGEPDDHPLRKDWEETLGYLRTHHQDVYNDIYDR